MIRFRCSQCGKKLKADEEIIGRKVQCVRCSHVEQVPEKDNLTKPLAKNRKQTSTKSRDDAQQDLVSDSKSTSKSSKPLHVSDPSKRGARVAASQDEPVPELFGHSAVISQPRGLDGPQFQITKKKKPSKMMKWALPAIGLAAAITLISVIAYVWIGKAYAEPKLRAEFESMPEVQFYQKAHFELEKARRVMSIMVQAFQATTPSASGLTESFNGLNQEAEGYTRNSKTLVKEAAQLMAEGKDIAAKSSLVNTAKKMNILAKQINDEVEAFNKTIHNR